MGGTYVEDARQPKAVLYGELSVGKRKTGGQKLRYKNVLKRHMKNGAINNFTWEKQAGHWTKENGNAP